MIFKYIALVLTLISGCIWAQKNDEKVIQILNKTTQTYNKATYISFDTQYTLYKDFVTKKIYESYNGFFVKKNGTTYLKVKSTEFITFKDCSLKINNEQRGILYSKNSNNEMDSPMAVLSALDGLDSKITEENGQQYVCELRPKKISQLMFHKIVLYINKKDYTLVKQCFYYVEKMESKNDQGKAEYTVPRLEITFRHRNKNEKKDELLVNKNNYFTVKGNTLVFSKKLSAYKLYKL